MPDDRLQPGPGKNNPFRLTATREAILSQVPFYPSGAKGSTIRMKLDLFRGVTFSDQTWHNWTARLTRAHPPRRYTPRVSHPTSDRHPIPSTPTPPYLIRLPGPLLSRPRTMADLVWHVPPRTKTPQPARLTLAQELTEANARIVAQLHRHAHPRPHEDMA